MTTIENITESFRASRKEAIKARLTLNAKSNWLQADSVAVLLAMAQTYHDALLTIEGDQLPDAQSKPLVDAADEQFRLIANDMANPSAFRQKLASNKVITVTDTPTRSKSSDLISDLK